MKQAGAIKYLKNAKFKAVSNLINIPGWKTRRKLLVFESDDWGTIRMPSGDVYEKLLEAGDKADTDPFLKYDSLASENDIADLFDTLSKFKDHKGNSPVFTANCAVANPDFNKIKASGFKEYYYEPFIETLQKYPRHKGSFALWQQGIGRKIFFPQLHCREHLNVARWMKHLREGKSDVLEAFSNKMIGTGSSYTSANKYAYMDACNYDSGEELRELKNIVKEGQELFKILFGYPSRSYIAACYIWGKDFEAHLADIGIEYIQGSSIQLLPRKGEGTVELGRKWHYIGQENRYKQIYLIRNCNFEPSWNDKVEWVGKCLKEIATAFKWNKPATVSTHRLNYIGYINENNRTRNLKLLSRLLSEIIKIWPGVEFITSVELGDLIKNERRLRHEKD